MANDRPSTAAGCEADPAPEVVESASIPALPTSATAECYVASHELLFAPTEEARCDACGDELRVSDDDCYPVSGRGAYMWVRGAEVRLQEAPLCASCASAIGMTALARWEIEEEEG